MNTTLSYNKVKNYRTLRVFECAENALYASQTTES